MKTTQRTNGFILPATILLSLAIAIIGAAFMQYIANSSQVLNRQTYTSIAQEAADAGISYAVSCVKQSVDPTTWSSLAPNTDCFGKTQTGSSSTTDCGGKTQSSISPYVMSAADCQWQSTFSVPTATVISTSPKEQQVVSTGTVSFFANGFQVGTVTVTRSVTLASSQNSVAVSTGNSLTALGSDTHSCAIANGQLYCWGDNSSGQLGQGNTTDLSVPTPVQTGAGQVFYNKMVTKLAVGTGMTCAIADGQLYCWGDNSSGQLGLGTSGNTYNTPQLVAATLPTDAFYGKKITSIAISKSTYSNKAACAVANGVTYCWGANTTQQVGRSTGSTADTTPLYTTPQPVYGYNAGDTNSAVLYGKKTQSVAIGAQDGCSSTTGTIYCWGTTSGSSSPAPPASVSSPDILEPLSLKSIGYTTTCGVGAGQMDCRSNGSGFSIKYGAEPEDQGSGAVDSFDGAENSGPSASPAPGAPYSGVTNDTGGESYCMWDAIYQALRCFGANLNGNPQSSSNASTTAYRGVTAIGIGGRTGSRYACSIMNGGLACWGTETQGQLADNTPSGTSKTQSNATFSTTTPGFGTDNAIYNSGYYPFKVAATGQIGAGSNHECAIASAQAVCWGLNSNGQLGTGDTGTQTQPTIITVETVPTCFGFWFFGNCIGIYFVAQSPVELVTAGGNHSCAVVDRLHNAAFGNPVPVSDIYCWGSNSSGELGTGNNTEYHAAQQVSLNGDKRITAVSAGQNNTCAIANFQLYCWGDNSYGQLGGTGSSPNVCANSNPLLPQPAQSCSNTPQLINGFTGMQVTAVSVGATHICAIANGNGYCWGDNSNAQLGMGSNNPSKNPAPQQILTGVANATDGNTTAAFTAIAAGDGYTCAVINGTAACWGQNNLGQTGTGAVSAYVSAPTTVAGAAGSMQADAIAAGDSHACAVLQARVYCWGNNANGRVGNNLTAGSQITPFPVVGGAFSNSPPLGATLNASISIAAGGGPSTSSPSGGTSCSVTNADIYCWGAGTSGQVGIAGTSDVGTPAQIPLYRSTGSSTIGPIY